MKVFFAGCLLGTLLGLAPVRLPAQASEIPSADTAAASAQTQEQHGKSLIDEMVTALGGQAWLDRHDVVSEGRTASFFQGRPTEAIINFVEYRQLPDGTHPEAERIEFLTPRMLLHGNLRDVVQVWTPDNGYEITYKGKTPLPKDQVEDYLRRRAHSIDAVVHTWLKTPGVMVVSEGTTMVGRRSADKVTVLSANNDAVTLELDATTHLPLRRTFEWRNQTFKDHDEDAEEYDDYHPEQGLMTPLTITRYRNGDMVNQRFYNKVTYNQTLSPGLFNPDNLLKKK